MAGKKTSKQVKKRGPRLPAISKSGVTVHVSSQGLPEKHQKRGVKRLDQNPVAVFLARVAKGSRRSLLHGLCSGLAALTGQAWLIDPKGDKAAKVQAVRGFEWHQLQYQHVAAIRAKLIEKYAAATCNRVMAAVRGTIRECWRLGLMSAEQYHRAVDVPNVKGTTLPRGRAISGGELNALFTAASQLKPAIGTRDAAIMGLAFGGGLRKHEIVSLDVSDYAVDAGELKIKGKGNRQRVMHVDDGGKDALDAWLKIRGDAPGALFHPINRGGRIHRERRLSDQGITLVCKRLLKRARVKEFSPHDARRTFISDLLSLNVDIATVSQMAGHSQIQTTARYDRRPEQRKKAAAKLLHIPFKPVLAVS